MSQEKKLQIFVSSTYKDLQAERQAAVEAILGARHIPAGMELFAAGSESQLEVIKKWIQESDVYMLILGGRYGTIESKSGKSYIEVEYEYAVDLDMPVFAVVITEKALDEKVKDMGKDVFEQDNKDKLDTFKDSVLSKTCRLFDDCKDIKIAIHESLTDIGKSYDLKGWVNGADVKDTKTISAENQLLKEENQQLKSQLASFKEELRKPKGDASDTPYGGFAFKELKKILSDRPIDYDPFKIKGLTGQGNLLNAFEIFSDLQGGNTDNSSGASDQSILFYYYVASPLRKYGLVQNETVPANVKWNKFSVSSLGYMFLAQLERERYDIRLTTKKKTTKKKK